MTRHIVLQLHRDLYAYSHKGIGGQFKNVQNSIIERLADGSEVERFKPLAPYERLLLLMRFAKVLMRFSKINR